MKASLKINTHEIGDYIVQNGISVSKDERVSKTVTTMNGRKWQKKIEKLIIDVTLSDMFDDVYREFLTFMTPNPATVVYSDFETGTTYTGTFYVDTERYSIDKSIQVPIEAYDAWAAETEYGVGDLVTNSSKLYRCITEHTSTDTFDSTKWSEIQPGLTYLTSLKVRLEEK